MPAISRSRFPVLAVTAAVLLGAWVCRVEAADAPTAKAKTQAKAQAKAQAKTEPTTAAASMPAPAPARSGLRAYVDPRTGELLKTPPATAATVSPSPLSAASARVVEEPVRGGGVRARVPREMLMMTTATESGDGAVTTRCAPDAQAKEAGRER